MLMPVSFAQRPHFVTRNSSRAAEDLSVPAPAKQRACGATRCVSTASALHARGSNSLEPVGCASKYCQYHLRQWWAALEAPPSAYKCYSNEGYINLEKKP